MGARDAFDARTGDLFTDIGGSAGDFLASRLDLDEIALWVLTRSLAALRHPAPGGRPTAATIEVLEWIFCPQALGGAGLTFDRAANVADCAPDVLREGTLHIVRQVYGVELAAACRREANHGNR